MHICAWICAPALASEQALDLASHVGTCVHDTAGTAIAVSILIVDMHSAVTSWMHQSVELAVCTYIRGKQWLLCSTRLCKR